MATVHERVRRPAPRPATGRVVREVDGGPRRALEQASALALAAPQGATTRFVRADDAPAALIGLAGPHGLLVLGGDSGSPASGMVARAALRGAAVPVLVARPACASAAGTPRILAAVDDSPAAAAVVEVAGEIAAGGGWVQLVHVAGSGYGARMRRRLAELSLELISTTGAEPVVDVLHARHAARSIVRFADRSGCTLLVVGRRGAGARAGGGVSERVALTACCSVLVVPPVGAAEVGVRAVPAVPGR
jgi:nucleotide-binding universal stress UspA family protein